MAEQEKIEKLPAERRAEMLSGEKSIFLNVALFEQAQRVATLFAQSTMVPQHFQKNVGNCLIGLNYAARMQADPFMVMQNMYIVHNRPGIEGKLVIAQINQSNKYSEPLKWRWLDADDKETTASQVIKHVEDGFGCRAYTKDAKSGEIVEGPKITWHIVKREGWYDKNGSKWHTIPELMFMYRSASWFANVNCPEVKLGMSTVEELEDIVDLQQRANGTYGPEPQLDLQAKIEEAGKDIANNSYSEPGQDQPKQDTQPTEETKKDDPGAPEKPKTFRDEWIDLRTPGFSTYVHKNKVRFEGCRGMAIYDEAKAKWEKLYPDEPWPLDAQPEPKGDELKKENNNTNWNRLIPCHLMDGQNIPVGRCDNPHGDGKPCVELGVCPDRKPKETDKF